MGSTRKAATLPHMRANSATYRIVSLAAFVLSAVIAISYDFARADALRLEAFAIAALILLALFNAPSRTHYPITIVAIGFAFLFFAPLLMQILIGYAEYQRYYFLSSACFALFACLLSVFEPAESITRNRSSAPAYLPLTLSAVSALVALGTQIIAPNEGEISILLPALAYSFALFYFERLCRSASTITLMVGAAFLLLPIGYYLLVRWDGFGRLYAGILLLGPILIATVHGRFPIPPWTWIVLAPLLNQFATVARYFRQGQTEISISQLEASVTGGSASAHIAMTDKLLSNAPDPFSTAQDLGRYWDQLLLFFAQPIPRSWWPEKPLGIGLTAVDDLVGREGISMAHSVSLGFIGEQIHLAGSLWPLTLIVTIAVILVTRTAIRWSRGAYCAPLIMFDLSLLMFVWGGMASFGSRVWLLVVPLIVLSHVATLMHTGRNPMTGLTTTR